MAFQIALMYNAASVLGRILPNFLSDKTGPIDVIMPCASTTGVLLFILVVLDAGQVGGFAVLSLLLECGAMEVQPQ
ncbi:hypothetical protein SNOG_16148 [Parastagonospora nodorum SN15]|uniref:Major facilitator superfamily (MFS) profile domain-containing protein n=1 Tax=Phaeosphaeria nodorum (strain SN15 / ATCC MYA-4574 / FGSC 10173) TaxID=321614 RepID=Q0TWL6_PHANO|nr:hypothetical protein SNOG_16148 [Parastagonospora nodorum SN15]EAT76520.1 hypothetical protein SNOG_16148 [Parastagonospora nodorum SN15]